MEQKPSPQVTTNKSKKSNKVLKIIPWLGLVSFILTAAAAAYFYSTKQLTVTAVGDAATTIVCDDAIVNTYNTASELKVRGSDTAPGTDVAGLAALDKDIRAKSGFEQDPTCQTILFWNAITINNISAAQTALTAIEKLHTSHHYADSNLTNTTSISTMKDSLSAATADSKS